MGNPLASLTASLRLAALMPNLHRRLPTSRRSSQLPNTHLPLSPLPHSQEEGGVVLPIIPPPSPGLQVLALRCLQRPGLSSLLAALRVILGPLDRAIVLFPSPTHPSSLVRGG